MPKILFALLIAACVAPIKEEIKKTESEPEKKETVEEIIDAKAEYQTCRKYDLAMEYQRSFACYSDLAKDDEALGYFGLASSYHYGKGIRKNIAKAVENYEKSANSGNDNAALALGSIYESGLYEKIDNKKAFEWYKVAAEAGNAKAELALSHLYASGKGVEKNDEQSKFWLEKSAKDGFSYAEYLMGKADYNRYLITKSPLYLEKAKEWLMKASDKGEVNAKELLKSLNM